MKAYWFEPADGKLDYGDGRKPKAGVTHTVNCKPVLCKRGLHGSVRALDALGYASSTIVWIVELGGEIVEGDDKCAATERTYIKRIDAESILRAFARWCALQVIGNWDALDVVRRYLETGDEGLRVAARAAAWVAAQVAARDATWDAALSAAYSAARDDAAWEAAASAAWSAARAAARDAAGGEYNRKLESMLEDA